MTAHETEILDRLLQEFAELRVDLKTHMAAEAACKQRVDNHDRVLFVNSGRAPAPGVSPAGLVPEHRNLMAALDGAEFIKRSLVGGLAKEVGRLLATALVLAAVMLAQSHFAGPAKAPAEKAQQRMKAE